MESVRSGVCHRDGALQKRRKSSCGLEQSLTSLPETLSALCVAWCGLLQLPWCLFVCGGARCGCLHGSSYVSAQFAPACSRRGVAQTCDKPRQPDSA